MIILKNISKIYRSKTQVVQALDGVDLSVNEGEIFGIIGTSGAGKSTLLHSVNLLEAPSHGQVIVADQNLTMMSKKDLRLARHHIGMIFQHFNLLASKTVYQNVALPLKLLGKRQSEIKSKVQPLLEIVGLTEKQANYPRQLSGGQKQRVAIARALACDPQVLLCDEATSSLDPKTTRTILELLKKINQQLILTILLITHELSVIKKICDRVAVLDQGKIVESGDIIDLFTKPRSNITKQLIHAHLRHELPQDVMQRLSPQAGEDRYPVLQIRFMGSTTAEPIISRLAVNMAIDINILQANIEFIKTEAVGMMVIELLCKPDKLSLALAYFTKQQVDVEILGYAKHTIH